MTTLCRYDTVLCADAVEFCPSIDHQDLVAVGTYEVLKDEKKEVANEEEPVDGTAAEIKRTGRLMLFRVSERSGSDGKIELDNILAQNTAAILDIKWSELENSAPCLALADALGSVSIHSLKNEALEQTASFSNGLEKVLCLSLDWSSRFSKPRTSWRLAVSQSDGTIEALELNNERGLFSASNWKAHDFEAWIAAFDAYDDNVILSGGDDGRLRRWDLRMNPPFSNLNSSRHSAGVCSIESHPTNENIVGTGSYDEHLFVWDKRNMRSPLLEYHIGGGVWRFRWHPTNPSRILTASMQNGFHVVDINLEGCETTILTHYHDGDHGNLGYGASWCHSRNPHLRDLKGTASFYDHSFHLWR
ncbi:WD40-repeat-containing domain protein, partial [Chytridium lagenaria]